MSGSDPELEQWMAAWQAGDETGNSAEGESRTAKGTALDLAAALRRRVERRSLGLALMMAFEVVFTVTAIVVLWRLARILGTPLDLFTLTTLAALAALAFAFTVWNRWGIWRPATESSSAYLDLSIARCTRRQKGLEFGWWLLGAEVVLFVPWIWHRLHAKADAPDAFGFFAAYGFLAAVGSMTAFTLGILGRRTRREIRALDELRDGLLGGADERL